MKVQIGSCVPGQPEWKTWLRNGEQYFRAASPKEKKSRFTPELRYNLLSMSLEGYVMAVSGFHNCLPYNHTYTDLMEALEKVIPLDPELRDQVLRHESIQDICTIESYHRSQPTQEALEELENAVMRIGELARRTCILP